MANEYKVKVDVEFNAIMGRLNNALDDFKAKLAAVGDAIGNKKIGTQLSSEFEKTVKKLNELNNTTITPSNVENYKKKLAELQDRLEKLKELQKELASTPFSVDTDAKKKELEDKKKELQDLLDNNKGVNFRKSRDWFAENAPDLQQQKETYLRLQREIKKLTNELNDAEKAQKNYTDGAKVLDQVVENAEEGFDKSAKALEEYAEQAAKAANEKLATTIQTQVNRFIGFNAILRYSKKYIQDLIKTYKEFDESLVAIAAVTGQTRDQMWANISVYNKMAQSLGTTTQEVINASKLYYQQGLTTTSVLKLTEETVKLATIAELDSADATEYLTTAMNGFKLSAEESTRVTDVWANLAAKTASDVDELAVAISKVASLAENAGMEIETASAFLNQMIETTREAPENLGTALKTIIARFQELKTSEEELSDGVDANKVEKALKSAGVALRGVDGQFRDFDDVILELSSKWNTLDRNTQRYIATIAAGSRQQSRFIAMVSDYEGLLRNVNYAYDSLGSADAQMAIFQEGLTASTNRLTAAWEGLYTSWSESATILTKLIDGVANFISMLADMGAGTSALVATVILLTTSLLAQAAAYSLRNMAMGAGIEETIKEIGADGAEIITKRIVTKTINQNTVGILANTAAAKEGLRITLAQTAANIAAVAPYALMAAGVLALAYAFVRLVTYNKQYLKIKENEVQTLNQVAAREKDAASNLGVLITEIEDAKKVNGDLLEIQQKITDQFGDEIKAVDLVGLSYDDLILKLKELQSQKERASANSYIATAQARAEKDFLDEALGQGRGKVTGIGKDGLIYENAYAKNGKVAGWDEKGRLIYSTVYVYKGQEYDTIEALQAAMGKDIGFNSILTDAESSYIAKTIIDSDVVDSELKTAQAAVESFVKYIDSQGDITNLFDEDNNIVDEYANQIKDVTAEVEKLYNTISKSQGDEAAQSFISFLKGDYAELNTQQINEFSNLINQVSNNEWKQAAQDSAKAYVEGLRTTWQQAFPTLNPLYIEAGISWAGTLQQAFINKFREEDPDVVAAAVNWANIFQKETGKALTSLDPDEIWENYIDALVEAGEEGVSSQLKRSFLSITDFSQLSFDHPVKQIKKLSEALSQLHDVTQDGLDAGEFVDLITDLSAQMDSASLATLTAGMTIDATTGKIKLGEDAAKALAGAKIAQARAEMEAGLQAAEEELSFLQLVKAEKEGIPLIGDLGKTEVGVAGDTEKATKAMAIYHAVLANKISYQQANAMLKSIGYTMEEVASAAAEAATGGADNVDTLIDQAQTRIQMYQTALTSLDNINLDSYISQTKKTGSSTSKTDDASKKYLETLKQLAEQLKETAEEAEAAAKREIAAILAVLEAEKAKLEEMQKEREEWRDKESEELELWIKAQIALLQEEQKAQEKAYQDNEDALSLQAEAAQTYYNQQIEAIQAKIDALDAESEAEDRLLKLQQARDAYNKAQNSKSRLVLTKGAGWIFKADQKEVTDARKQLQEVQREIQKAAYQDQIDELQKQADEWEKIADGIGKSAEEIAKLAAAVEEFGQGVAAGSSGYADIDAFTKAVEALQEQKATMDFNADETAAGSLAYQIAQLEEALEKVGRSFEDQLLAERLEAITEVLRGQNEEQGYADTTGQILGHVETYMQEFSKVAHEYSETAARIAEIEKSIELWKSIDENLGLTVEEIEEAKKLYDKYSKKFEKFGTKAFDEQSKAYKAMLDKIGEIAKYFSEAKEAEEKAKTYEQATKNGFSSGGVVDFYGPADLHGTIAEPEVVFNARQASALFNWVKSLSSFGIPQINGVNPTPVVTTSNNSMRTNTISIGELYINSSANNFDGLVADITRNSMLRQPI